MRTCTKCKKQYTNDKFINRLIRKEKRYTLNCERCRNQKMDYYNNQTDVHRFANECRTKTRKVILGLYYDSIYNFTTLNGN